MGMTHFKAPQLPKPPIGYDAEYSRQLIRIFALYFSQLDSNTPRHAESYTADVFYGSLIGTTSPGNTFVSNTDQHSLSIANAQVVTFDTSLFTDTIPLVGTTKISPTYPGIYRFDYSMQAENPNTVTEIVDIWYRRNGVDVPNSNNRFGVPPRKSATSPGIVSSSADFFINLAGGDYVELVWHVSDIAVFLDAAPVQVGPPAIPATPSVVCNVAFISLASP